MYAPIIFARQNTFRNGMVHVHFFTWPDTGYVKITKKRMWEVLTFIPTWIIGMACVCAVDVFV